MESLVVMCDAVVKVHDATLVEYLLVTDLPRLCQGLVKAA